jgi:ABC-type uncharacterized transport system involved in gliding motility auxiliary subunit
VQIRKDLRQVRRQLDAEIEALGSRLKFLNIIFLPVLLALGAATLAWWRRKRAA